MRIYTVTGLVDEESGDLYVSGVFPGRHESADKELTTRMEGYGELSRFTGYFDADDAGMAAAIAVDVVKKYADDDAAQWSPPGESRLTGRHADRRIEDVKTDRL